MGEIDLEDYGFETDTKWNDLSEEDKNEITDNLSVLNRVYASIEEIKNNYGYGNVTSLKEQQDKFYKEYCKNRRGL